MAHRVISNHCKFTTMVNHHGQGHYSPISSLQTVMPSLFAPHLWPKTQKTPQPQLQAHNGTHHQPHHHTPTIPPTKQTRQSITQQPTVLFTLQKKNVGSKLWFLQKRSLSVLSLASMPLHCTVESKPSLHRKFPSLTSG